MSRRTTLLASAVFVLLLIAFWPVVRSRGVERSLGGNVGSAYVCLALLLAPLWFFGFGLADTLKRVTVIQSDAKLTALARIFTPALLAVPYCVYALPRGEFHWIYAAEMAAIPCAACAILEFSKLEQKFAWQDALVLFSLALILLKHLLSPAWPHAGLGSLPKIYLADVALYAYLVVRGIEGMGYSLVPQRSAFAIAAREWLFFFPFAMVIGFSLHFIRFVPRAHSAGEVASSVIGTFLLIAVPEELFFRGILQNLLEALAGRTRALVIASLLFGLSHYPKGSVFNWRYVILASIAGLFYGRAWRAKRQLLASSVTHTLVDVVWGLWFR